MNYFNFVKEYADQIGGQFTSYDSSNSILVVPVGQGRFQTLVMTISKSLASGRERGIISSKICEFNARINAQDLLYHHARFDYSKFLLDDGHLKVEASFPIDGASEDEIKCMIQEVASLADSFELKLTGKDIH